MKTAHPIGCAVFINTCIVLVFLTYKENVLIAMKYQKINNANELDELIQLLNKDRGDFSFIKEKDLIIKGVFYEEYEPDNEYEDVQLWFEFGRTIRPNEIKVPEGTVFEKLRSYGSSKIYSGLLSRKGDVIIPNIYHSIDYLGEGLFRVEKSKLYGVINSEGKTICEVKYDRICDLSEFTIGVVKDGKIGYIDCFGNIVIPIDYLYWIRNPNAFKDGKVLVEKAEEDGERILEYELDHYKNIVSKYIKTKDVYGRDYYEDVNPFKGSTAGNIDHDILDAYEGDASNMWNTY